MIKTGVALWCFLALALLLTGLIIPAVVADPFFSGDAAHRMHLAQYPAIRMDNRVWLPMLQFHIWVLYQFQAPLFVFKLIPCVYYFTVIVLVGMLAFNQTGRTRSGLIFSLVFAFCFARQEMVMSLGMSLMQEIIGLALFFFLLQTGALELKKKWWLLLAAAAALMTRDSFWIYLFVISLLNWKKILSDRTYIYSFLALWSVPILWLLLIPVGYWFADGRLPDFPTEWPLGINKDANQAVSDLGASLSSLWLSLTTTRIVYFIASLVVLWTALQIFRLIKGSKASPSDRLSTRFKPFSLISLGIIYTLIILFDPFQATPGSGRMSLPLFVHACVWAMILFAEASVSHRAMKYAAVLLVFSGLAMSIRVDELVLRTRDFTQVKQVYQEIAGDLSRIAPDKEARICILDEDYFSGLQRLLPPTFYRKRIMVLQTKNSPLRACDVVFVEKEAKRVPDEGFTAYKNYLIKGFAYTLFIQKKEQ